MQAQIKQRKYAETLKLEDQLQDAEDRALWKTVVEDKEASPKEEDSRGRGKVWGGQTKECKSVMLSFCAGKHEFKAFYHV